MNRQELADLLNGRNYGDEITQAEDKQAKESGLLVVFGASDDLTEFRGIIYDEMGGGSVIKFTKEGVFPDEDELEVLAKFKKDIDLNTIEAVWSPDEPECSWLIKTDLPHSTFDIIEDGELYCRGVVIDGNDLK